MKRLLLTTSLVAGALIPALAMSSTSAAASGWAVTASGWVGPLSATYWAWETGYEFGTYLEHEHGVGNGVVDWVVDYSTKKENAEQIVKNREAAVWRQHENALKLEEQQKEEADRQRLQQALEEQDIAVQPGAHYGPHAERPFGSVDFDVDYGEGWDWCGTGNNVIPGRDQTAQPNGYNWVYVAGLSKPYFSSTISTMVGGTPAAGTHSFDMSMQSGLANGHVGLGVW